MKTLLSLAVMATTAMVLPLSVQAETAPGPSEKPASAHPAKAHAKSHKAAEKAVTKDQPVQAEAVSGSGEKDHGKKAKKSASKKDSKEKDKQIASHPDDYDAMIAEEARKHGVPESLIHRVVMRESRYQPTAFHRVYFGLMQITYATAHGMGYDGAPKGLLDAATNLAYAVPYLANAYIVADKDPDRAVQLYAGGYYYEAKRKHKLGELRTAKSEPLTPPPVTQVAQTQAPPPASNPVSRLFGALLGSPAPQQQGAAPEVPTQQAASSAQDSRTQQPAPAQQAVQATANETNVQTVAADSQKATGGESAASETVKERSEKESSDKPVKTASAAHSKPHAGKAALKLAAKTPTSSEAPQTAAAK